MTMNVRTNRITHLLALASSFILTAGFITSCSNSPASSSNNTVNAPAVSVPVLITDAPSDQLVAFSLTIDSIVLNGSKGSATVLSTPTTIEICHLNGIQAPLVTANIAQDTYTSAVITFSSPEITYISSAGAAITVTPTLATTSYTYTFPMPGPFTISSSSSGALLFDLIASKSVNIVGTTVTVTPTFTVTGVPAASAVPPPGQNGTGMQQMATVVSVSGTSLTLEPGSGPNFTVTTNSSTLLQGFSALSALTAGELVQVDFILLPGPCPLSVSNACIAPPPVLLATRIQLAQPTAVGPPINLLTGPVLSVSSGGFKMALMQGLGVAASAAATTSIVTVTTNSSTVYAIAPQFVSLSALPFTPTFTSANLSPGQTVGVVASVVSPVPNWTATATNVTLMPQTLGGTVTAISTVGTWTAYTLSLPSGSAFATLSGASAVTVYTNANTAPPPPTPFSTAPPIAVNSVVRFNGLVFSTGGGAFAMVAGCSPDGPPGI
jgi:hypothetical protein